jgi:hypothetical protein
MGPKLPILNLAEARFECTFGRGCEGVCCRDGRPLIYPEERERLDANLAKILPRLRPEARARIARAGWLGRRRRLGQPILRRAGSYCVFFNGGCVLEVLGAEEGERLRYKPSVCALFPIQQDEHDRWYVRQKGFKGETSDLFCLDPAASPKRAADALRDEIALATRYDREATAAEAAAARGARSRKRRRKG